MVLSGRAPVSVSRSALVSVSPVFGSYAVKSDLIRIAAPQALRAGLSSLPPQGNRDKSSKGKTLAFY